MTGWILLIVLTVPASAWQGYVGSTLWHWYAEPVGAPHLSVGRAMGLAVLFAMYRLPKAFDRYKYKEQGGERSDKEVVVGTIAVLALGPAFALFFGWLYTFFL